MSKYFNETTQELSEDIAIKRQGHISEEFTREIPNSETISAINEVQQMKQNPSLGKLYTDIDKMMKDLLI